MNDSEPFHRPDRGPPMRPSFVCHADILGFRARCREAMETGQGQVFLQRFYHVLYNAYLRLLCGLAADGAKEGRFAMKVFTDNFVLGYPVRGSVSEARVGEIEWGQLLPGLADFQLALATEGFLLRGAIAFGNHFMDSYVVFGEAFLDATDADRGGEPPRIVLHPSAEHVVRQYSKPLNNWLRRDLDGKLFIDYVGCAFNRGFNYGRLPFDVARKHKGSIEEGLAQYRGQFRVFAKYEWAARYHNSFCRHFVESHAPPELRAESGPRYACSVEANTLRQYLIDIEAFAANRSSGE